MVPVSKIVGLEQQALAAFVEEWDRQATPSEGWLRLPSRSLELDPPQTVDELRDLERRLSGVAARVEVLTFEVASAREVGQPPGYVWPSLPLPEQ